MAQDDDMSDGNNTDEAQGDSGQQRGTRTYYQGDDEPQVASQPNG